MITQKVVVNTAQDEIRVALEEVEAELRDGGHSHYDVLTVLRRMAEERGNKDVYAMRIAPRGGHGA